MRLRHESGNMSNDVVIVPGYSDVEINFCAFVLAADEDVADPNIINESSKVMQARDL